jgi:N-acetylglucosamine-6-phosphate deacetylase
VLGGRRIVNQDGRLTGPDGALAGSSLDMASAVRNAQQFLQIDLATAVRMASAVPARAMRMQDRGEIRPGFRADLVLMNERGEVTESWIGGRSEAR